MRTERHVDAATGWSLEDWDDLWRPGRWTSSPPAPTLLSTTSFLLLLGLIVVANVLGNTVVPPPLYIPFNIGVVTVALVVARRASTSWISLGLDRRRALRGAAVGVLAAVPLVIVVVALAAYPDTRGMFEDTRIVERSVWLSLYHALLRIPIGTAVYEELLFRGIVFAFAIRRWTVASAAIASSVLFGLWHVLPALTAITVNPIGDAFGWSGGTAVAVTLGVVATTLSGLAFTWLRLFANSVIAPSVAHALVNAAVVLAGVIVVHA